MAFPLINKVSPEPVEDSLERSSRVARRALNTPLAMISWFDPTNGVHQVSSEEGAIDYSGDTRVSQMARDIAEHVVTRKQLWAVSDAGENLILNQTLAVKQSGVVSCISVPIRNTRDDRILGALSCMSFTPRAWTEEDEQVLAQLGELVDGHFASYLGDLIEAPEAGKIKAKAAPSDFWETANYEFRTPLKLISEASRVNGGVKFGHCGGAKVGQFGASALERAALI